MNDMRFLYELQQVDLQIDARHAAIERIDEDLRTDDSVARAQQAVSERKADLKSAQTDLQQIESEVAEVTHRSDSISKALYAGQIKNSRELGQMEAEIAHLKDEKSRLEDLELDAMMNVDAADTALKEAKQALEAAETDWAAKQDRLAGERGIAESELGDFNAQRSAMLAANPDLDRGLYEKYERLRKTRRGLAIAVIENSACAGCRVSLPKAALQEARTANHPVVCSSCGRILYAGR